MGTRNSSVVRVAQRSVVVATLVLAVAAFVPSVSTSVGASVPGKPSTQTGCEEYSDSVARLYTAGLGREPDERGFDWWFDEYRTGEWSLPRAAAHFAGSPEFVATYGALGDDAFVGQLYRNVLGREGDETGVGFWNSELAQGMTRGTVLLRFAESPENITNSGTAQPALGFFNEGVDGPWVCGPIDCPTPTLDQLLARLPVALVEPGTDVGPIVDQVGGVGLLGHHSASSVAAISAAIDTAAIPPFLASDEEGGRVQRLDQVLGALPSANEMAQLSGPDARARYLEYSNGMAELGIDANFAPVLATGSSALGDRSYSSDPSVVAAGAGAFVDAMRDAGVLPVLKHFPGLGGTDLNTDHGSATTPPLDELRTRDLVPYELLLDDGPMAVMMANAVVPDLTDGRARLVVTVCVRVAA